MSNPITIANEFDIVPVAEGAPPAKTIDQMIAELPTSTPEQKQKQIPPKKPYTKA